LINRDTVGARLVPGLEHGPPGWVPPPPPQHDRSVIAFPESDPGSVWSAYRPLPRSESLGACLFSISSSARAWADTGKSNRENKVVPIAQKEP
jgi:hypothetical protein